MRVERLSPKPSERTRFAWSHHVTVPDKAGCYALVTYDGTVLYVGLATSIRGRMGSHLDTEEKRKGTNLGVPFWFDYLIVAPESVAAIERGWLNQAMLTDGRKPPLNKISSPL